MHEYSFISIPIKRNREGSYPEADYREVIREQAAAGWEFVQAIPFESVADPYLDLVFKGRTAP